MRLRSSSSEKSRLSVSVVSADSAPSPGRRPPSPSPRRPAVPYCGWKARRLRPPPFANTGRFWDTVDSVSELSPAEDSIDGVPRPTSERGRPVWSKAAAARPYSERRGLWRAWWGPRRLPPGPPSRRPLDPSECAEPSVGCSCKFTRNPATVTLKG